MNKAELSQPPQLPEVIVLPDDELLQRKLTAKLEEYESRDTLYAGHYTDNTPADFPPMRMGNREVMKKLLLNIVLTEGSISLDRFEELIEEKYKNLRALKQDIEQVYLIINDYCTTGGENTTSGTGLAELITWEDLPKTLVLPDDQESLENLANMLNIANKIIDTPLEERTGGGLVNAYKSIVLGTLLVHDNLEVSEFIEDMKKFGGYDEEAAIEAVRSVAVHL